MPKFFLIPAELAQTIGNYLVQKPYCEVAQFLAELGQMKPAPEAAPPKTD